MPVREFFLQRAVGRHAVVHAPRQVADFRVQRAAHGDIEFLKAPADGQQRRAVPQYVLDQMEYRGIPIRVQQIAHLRAWLAVMMRLDVGWAAGE